MWVFPSVAFVENLSFVQDTHILYVIIWNPILVLWTV